MGWHYYYRSSTKTANEKRQVESCEGEEYPIKIRGRRRAYYLNLVKVKNDRRPLTSDMGTVLRSTVGMRSWKNYRKTRWKTK